MAVIANTFQTSSSKTNRESLSDVVSRITPEDTPIYSLISKEATNSVHPEWSVDVLAAPGDNAQAEGDEYSFDAITPPDRMGNYTQIFRKDWILSATQEAVSDAGRVLKRKEQKLKRGIELRKDVEYSIVAANASVAGATRKSGSLSTWLKTNASRGATGANGGFSTGTGLTVAPTNGTQRAFDKATLDSVMQAAHQAGGNTKFCVVSPYVKSVFVGFMSNPNVATFRYNVESGEKNSIVANADIYEGPFGTITVLPNRVMSGSAALARNAFLIDPGLLKWAWLRKIAEDKGVAKTGDAEKGVIIGEGCLVVKNEAGLGVISDLFGMNATT